MSCNPLHLREIIRQTLREIDARAGTRLHSPAAEGLLLLTCAAESDLGRHLWQLRGPALGVYQMEPSTLRDHLAWCRRRPALWDALGTACLAGATLPASQAAGPAADSVDRRLEQALPGNLWLATALARIHYYRVPTVLPESPEGWAAYWKRHYNTRLGRGDPAQALAAYRRHCAALEDTP